MRSNTKGRPFGSYSKKTIRCLQNNMEAIKSTKNKKSGEYDDSIRIDLCPMATHTKYRWIFNTTKVDWDLPKP
jgi:hypothetical protein